MGYRSQFPNQEGPDFRGQLFGRCCQSPHTQPIVIFKSCFDETSVYVYLYILKTFSPFPCLKKEGDKHCRCCSRTCLLSLLFLYLYICSNEQEPLPVHMYASCATRTGVFHPLHPEISFTFPMTTAQLLALQFN